MFFIISMDDVSFPMFPIEFIFNQGFEGNCAFSMCNKPRSARVPCWSTRIGRSESKQ